MQTLHDCESVLTQHDDDSWKDSIPPEIASCINKFHDECITSLSDDLHTPVALAAMSEPLKIINDLLHTRKVFLVSVVPESKFSCDFVLLASSGNQFCLYNVSGALY